MRIEVRAFEPMQGKQPCFSCGMWERPGEPAYFLVDDDGEAWICEVCVEGGEERIRQGFRERAEQHRRIAASYEEIAGEEITFPPPGEWERAGEEVRRYYAPLLAEARAEAARANNADGRHLRSVGDSSDDPSLDELRF